MIFVSWIVLSIVCGVFGDYRKIGGVSAFFIALIFSPIIGFVVVALSERKQKKLKTVEFLHHPTHKGRYLIESTHGEMVKLSGIAELVHMSELDSSSIASQGENLAPVKGNKGFVLFLVLLIAVIAYIGKSKSTTKNVSAPKPVSSTLPRVYNIADDLNSRSAFREEFYCIAKNKRTLIFDQNSDSFADIKWLRGYLGVGDYSTFQLFIRYKDGREEQFTLK